MFILNFDKFQVNSSAQASDCPDSLSCTRLCMRSYLRELMSLIWSSQAHSEGYEYRNSTHLLLNPPVYKVLQVRKKLAYRDGEVAKIVCLSLGNISCKRTSVTGYAATLLNLLGDFSTRFPPQNQQLPGGCRAVSRPAWLSLNTEDELSSGTKTQNYRVMIT